MTQERHNHFLTYVIVYWLSCLAVKRKHFCRFQFFIDCTYLISTVHQLLNVWILSITFRRKKNNLEEVIAFLCTNNPFVYFFILLFIRYMMEFSIVLSFYLSCFSISFSSSFYLVNILLVFFAYTVDNFILFLKFSYNLGLFFPFMVM